MGKSIGLVFRASTPNANSFGSILFLDLSSAEFDKFQLSGICESLTKFKLREGCWAVLQESRVSELRRRILFSTCL